MSTKKESQEEGPITKGLLSRRTVALGGEIDRDSMADLLNKVLKLQIESSEPIYLIIDSGGGIRSDALAFCDVMTSLLTAPVHGIVIGRCCSAATFILLHCTKRISTRHSQFMIHSGRIQGVSVSINETTSENLKHLLAEAVAGERLVLDLYLRKLTPRTWKKKKPDEEACKNFIKDLIQRGDGDFNEYLSAQEALEVGLIEEITEEKLGIF